MKIASAVLHYIGIAELRTERGWRGSIGNPRRLEQTWSIMQQANDEEIPAQRCAGEMRDLRTPLRDQDVFPRIAGTI